MAARGLTPKLFGRWRAPQSPPLALPPGNFVELDPTGYVAVVGVSHYQPALEQIVARCAWQKERKPRFPVALVPEPTNPHDSKAIAVMTEIGCVGYLSRENARRYRPFFKELLKGGYDGASVTATVGRRSYKLPLGVLLRMPYPEELNPEPIILYDEGNRDTHGIA